MNRRAVITSAGAVLSLGLAGCIGGRRAPPESTPTEPPTTTPTESPTAPPTSFVVTDAGCGRQTDRAEVSAGDGRVIVRGSTWGSDACFTARLHSASLTGDVLTVRVVAVRDAEPNEGCAQCITEIHYRATVEVDPLPETVVVVHGGEEVHRTQV